MALHCPFCGDELSASALGELECKRGDMQLSKELERRFRDVFEFSLRPAKRSPLDVRSGRWYCPGCGAQLELAEDGIYRCPNCCKTIGEFVYPLIELHPHRRGAPWESEC